MRIRTLLQILLVFLCTSSCIDEYWPELDKYENLLVVDGILSNTDNSIVVRLSLSSSLSNQKLIPVGNGDIYITDDNQTITELTETVPGTYHALDSSFRGKIGYTYKLHINLPNGKSYESDDCFMKPSAHIDSIYGIIEYTGDSESSQYFPGIQFYIENHNEVNDTSYYLWKVIQTYKYRSTFDIDYTWEGELIPNPNADSLRTCWNTTRVNEILVATTGLLDPTAVNQFPLHFVTTETKLLSFKYSPLVKQLSISKSAFDFFNAIDEQNIETANLWATQPYQILGNMHNVNNPDEPVLGYFVVGGATEKRIFVNNPPLEFYYDVCAPDFEAMRFIAYESEDRWPIYIDDIMFLGLAMANSKVCFDCRLDGGSITPPDFWEE